ncbi:hypothetical protein A9267_10330 [Shewanella sp. UCD-FRSSP16_17]|uniref:hypothetical protein n=1 Tax=Shewanella sp. UCD-FRSSP16_17 TaxID=1853256 RepID=UPI0007EEDF27|nr:hypothetical protein [Shewanella sp. UCD-FRSSP16_17]OBT08112.1 hypothetical protein A9267_10330 [Shewanella sp. UCD-FRSSP16_17]
MKLNRRGNNPSADASKTFENMDVFAELRWTYLKRVLDESVQKPAAGNWLSRSYELRYIIQYLQGY